MAKCLLPSNGNNNEIIIKIINFFINKGLTPEQACGICANVWQESKYNPKSDNPKDFDSNGRPGHSHGLFQWRDGTDGSNVAKNCSSKYGHRFTDLYRYCTKNNLDYDSADAQLSFCWHENSANFQKHFSENKNMTAEEACKWWKENWEVGCCLGPRLEELKKVKQIYNSNVKTDDCSISSDSGNTDESYVCDPTSMAYTENTEVYSDEASIQKYYSEDHPYEPFGANTPNAKPVFFGGTWAHYMSYYMSSNNDFLTYTISDGLLDEIQTDGKKRWVTMGGQRDYVNSDTISTSIIQHIQNYLSVESNVPKFIVVYIDMSSIKTFSPVPKTKRELLNQLTQRLIKFFQKIKNNKVIIPLLVNSWKNVYKYKDITFDYRDFNNSIAKAAKCAGKNFITVNIADGDELNEYTYKGSKKATILPTWGFEKLSKVIKNYCKKYG